MDGVQAYMVHNEQGGKSTAWSKILVISVLIHQDIFCLHKVVQCNKRLCQEWTSITNQWPKVVFFIRQFEHTDVLLIRTWIIVESIPMTLKQLDKTMPKRILRWWLPWDASIFNGFNTKIGLWYIEVVKFWHKNQPDNTSLPTWISFFLGFSCSWTFVDTWHWLLC